MALQLNIFLLLFGGLQGLLLSLFLIKKKLYRSGYIFLLLYFGVMLLQITLKVMSKHWLRANWEFLYSVSYFLPLLYGPLIFLFVRQLLLNKKLTAFDLLHLFPFLFFFVYLRFDGSFTQDWIYFIYKRKTELFLQLGSVAVYHGMAMHCWMQHRNSLKNYFSETQRLQMNWIRQFIMASFVVCSVIVSAIYLLYMNYPRGAEFRYGFVTLTIFIYWISYAALTRPSIFSVIKGKTAQEDIILPVLPKLVVHRPAKKYSNSGLHGDYITTLRAALERVMRDKKPYLNPELTINELAELVKCNRHHLSQVLNESLQQSFYDYVNHFRVEEAKQLLIDPAKASHKIAAVAYEAGFNSLSTFNDVFRKTTGQTPSQYRKQNREESKQQRV